MEHGMAGNHHETQWRDLCSSVSRGYIGRTRTRHQPTSRGMFDTSSIRWPALPSYKVPCLTSQAPVNQKFFSLLAPHKRKSILFLQSQAMPELPRTLTQIMSPSSPSSRFSW
jgi:hypothetical protein